MGSFTARAATGDRWSLTQWPAERTSIISNMQQVMGPLPGASRRCALDLEVLDETDAATFVRRRIAYTSEPGSRVNAFLLLPKQAGKHPAALALHQTHPLGSKVVVGLGN